MNILRGQRGSFSGFVLVFLLIAAIYVGMSFAKPYYRYSTFKSQAKDLIKIDGPSVEKITDLVRKASKEFEVPLQDEDLKVTVSEKGAVKLSAKWFEIVDFFGYYQKRLDFEFQAEY